MNIDELVAQSALTATTTAPGWAVVTEEADAKIRAAIADRLSGGVLYASHDGTVGLRPRGADVAASVPSNGVAYFRDGAADTDFVIQTPGAGIARIFVVMKSAGAPPTFDFDVDLPIGARLMSEAAGVVVQDARGTNLLTVAAPWALDATGREVPAKFTIADSTLTLSVDHQQAEVAYPVVADPFAILGALLIAVVVAPLVNRVVADTGRAITGNPCFSVDIFEPCRVLAPGTSFGGRQQGSGGLAVTPALPSAPAPQPVAPNLIACAITVSRVDANTAHVRGSVTSRRPGNFLWALAVVKNGAVELLQGGSPDGNGSTADFGTIPLADDRSLHLSIGDPSDHSGCVATRSGPY